MNNEPFSIGAKLEQYTLKNPQEVLLVEIEKSPNQDKDQIIIFKGFSSSLMGSTNFDPDVPVIPSDAQILRIDRLKSPYNPSNPVYIQQGLSSKEMEFILGNS